MNAKGNIAAFEIDGTHFYGRTDSPDTLYYLPGEPIPEADSLGRPTLTLLQTPSTSILQLGVQFTLSNASQKAALTKIAAQQPLFASARLQPAFVTVRKVAVLLADNSGSLTELKSSVSSSFPPYATVFSLSLTPAQAAQAVGALNGRSGLLLVEYTITVPAEVIATMNGATAQQVRRTDVGKWFPGSDGISHLRLAG
jgi:hypothetical protein